MIVNKSVLVLGGNGFIGSNLCKALLHKGYEVTSFDRVLPQKHADGVKYIEGDFFDNDTLKKIVSGADVIVHAISTINPGNSNTDYMRGYQKDFIQSVRLCELARDNKCKLIFLSSGGTVYGKQDIQPIKEDAYPRPINHYGNLKLCIENTMLTFAMQNGLDFKIARISNPYGPGQDFEKGVGFVDAAIRNALSGNTIEVWGDGEVVRDYIYIDDVCAALIALIELDRDENNDIVNICTGIGTSINQILDIVKSCHGNIKVNYKDKRTVDLDRVVLSNERLKSIIDAPLLDIKEGIRTYYNYVRENWWK